MIVGETTKVSLAEAVREEIRGIPHIKNSLSEGIVNYSALARKIMSTLSEKTGKKLNEESVIVAIKRYADEIEAIGINHSHASIFAEAEIAMQDDISYIHFKKNERVISRLTQLFANENWKIGEMRVLIHGGEQVMLLANSKRAEEIALELSGEIIKRIDNSALVTVKMPIEFHDSYGVIAEISSLLSRKGISIEIISYPSDLHIVVDEKNAERTYVTLKQLINESRRRVKEKSGQ